MGNVTVSWYDDQCRAIMITFIERWNWEQFDTGWDETARMMQTTPRPVHLILDSSRGPLPPDAHVLNHFQRTWRVLPKNTGMVILLGASSFMEKMSGFFANAVATGLDFRTARNLEDVDRLLAEQE